MLVISSKVGGSLTWVFVKGVAQALCCLKNEMFGAFATLEQSAVSTAFRVPDAPTAILHANSQFQTFCLLFGDLCVSKLFVLYKIRST
jgi:hypothetical protein